MKQNRKLAGVGLIAALTLALFLAAGCTKTSEPAAATGPLFFAEWGAGYDKIVALEDAADMVSAARELLVYKKISGGYPVFVSYEFADDKLIRLFLNVNVKNGGGDSLADDWELLITRHLGAARYVFGDSVWFLGADTLVEMQINDSGGLQAKISLYDVNASQNSAFVDDFEKYWQDERWAKGEVRVN